MAKNYFSVVDIAITFVSLFTFILDVSTDVLVCVQLHLDGQQVWGWLMVIFITLPAILMSAFSLTWNIHDKSATRYTVVSHFLLLAPAHRYLNVIYFGVKSYKSQKVVFLQRALRAQSDVSILRLIEAFLESAPQLVLQLYILVYKRNGDWFTGVSAACSLVSLTWAVTAYSDSQRRAHRTCYQRRLIRLIFHWFWQLFMSAGRIAAFVFFACALHNWVLAVMGGHWLIAFVWISIRGTDFGSGCCEKWMFRLVCAFIYIFVFLNLNDGASRWRITTYYVLVLLENTGMMVVFLVLGDGTDMILLACLVVFAGFFMGLLCMLIYYAFLHPSGTNKGLKRFLQPNSKSLNTSGSLKGPGPQIFSIESPNPIILTDGTTIDLSLNSGSSHNSAAATQQTWMLDQSTESSQKNGKVASLSKQTLQLAWQSGMESSSGSSSTSSLVSTGKPSGVGNRTPSVRSENSNKSVSSENHLLPPLLKRNDLSKSPKRDSKVGQSFSKKEFAEDVSESDNLNVQNGESRSPTLSRSSWARSSDHNRQSLLLEDFTMLGFDDSSSAGRRASDCSSFNSQPKSLSPLNISSLWKDAHSRLRATIAATIAAATGNPSSSEGTPNRNRSISSYNSAVSGLDSLNSTHNNTSSLTHNTAFMDSGSSFREKIDGPSYNTSQDSTRHREALSSLPDISETFDHERVSDSGTADINYNETTSRGSMVKIYSPNTGDKTMAIKSPACFSKESNSPYPQDSTLTASKLEMKRTVSYLDSQRRHEVDQEDPRAFEQGDSPLDLSFRSPRRTYKNDHSFSDDGEHKGTSPFTDQELVYVMAKSLREYIGDSSSHDTTNPEREGLALTMDDLRFSRESSPSGSPLSHQAKDTWKSRSASSLFHDSTESSPISSASKMNRAASVQKAEDKLSPNAFKQLEGFSQTLKSLYPDLEEQTLATIPQSLALKFIIEAYGSTALTSPHLPTPVSQKSFHLTKSGTKAPKRISAQVTPPQFVSQQKRDLSGSRSSHRHSNSRTVVREVHDQSPGEVRTYSKKLSPCAANRNESLVSRKSRFSTRDLDIIDRARHPQTHSGVSSTKKLNVRFKDFPILEYDSSPYRRRHLDVESDCGSETTGYVAGEYCPPLCDSDEIEAEENSIQRNLNCERRNSYDLNSIKKSVLEVSCDEGKEQKVDRIKLSEDHTAMLDSLRKELVRRDSRHEKQQSDFFHLRQLDSFPMKKFQSSKSQPSLQYQSPTFQYQDNIQETIISKLKDTVESPASSYCSFHDRPASRSFNQGHALDDLTEDELNCSAKHVTEYFADAPEKTSKPYYKPGSKKHHSQSQLHVYGRRQPLQRLDNSQHLSPDTNRNTRKQSEPEYFLSPTEYSQPSRGVDRISLAKSKDMPKLKLMFESEPGLGELSKRITSRPPVHRSDKSRAEVHFTTSK